MSRLAQTGERFLPGEQGQNRYEHLHRYVCASRFARKKDVLDIASGEGYGAALYARVARSVVGVDVSREAVEHARHSYFLENLRFLTGDCAAIPLPDHSVDLVTSFETIEHHERHEEMFVEISRVLRPDGILIISSPNRLVYSDEVGFSNPFHVKELYFDEFAGLCRRYFPHVELYGQLMGAASFLVPLGTEPVAQLAAIGSERGPGLRGIDSPSYPMYFVAVCGRDAPPQRNAMSSFFLDIDDDFFGRLTRPQVARVWQSVSVVPTRLEADAPPLAIAGAPASQSIVVENEAVKLLEAVRAQLEHLTVEYDRLRAAHDAQSNELSALRNEFEVRQTEAAQQKESALQAALAARTLAESHLKLANEERMELASQVEAERRAKSAAVETAVERNRRLAAFSGALSRATGGAEQWRAVATVLQSELTASLAVQDALRAQLDRIVNSRSWRATAMLRKTKAVVAGRNGS